MGCGEGPSLKIRHSSLSRIAKLISRDFGGIIAASAIGTDSRRVGPDVRLRATLDTNSQREPFIAILTRAQLSSRSVNPISISIRRSRSGLMGCGESYTSTRTASIDSEESLGRGGGVLPAEGAPLSLSVAASGGVCVPLLPLRFWTSRSRALSSSSR